VGDIIPSEEHSDGSLLQLQEKQFTGGSHKVQAGVVSGSGSVSE
jgi:hypothetical protein